MQVLQKQEMDILTSDCDCTYFSTTVFQQDVDILLVFKMMVKVHNVFMVQDSVQLNFSVNLTERKKHTHKTVTIAILTQFGDICYQLSPERTDTEAELTFSRWWGLETRAWGMILAA